MRITGLKLHNFRNYASLELVPEPGINVPAIKLQLCLRRILL